MMLILVLSLTGKHAVGKPMINAGLMALTSITLINALGIRWFLRTTAYEVYIVAHIIIVSYVSTLCRRR